MDLPCLNCCVAFHVPEPVGVHVGVLWGTPSRTLTRASLARMSVPLGQAAVGLTQRWGPALCVGPGEVTPGYVPARSIREGLSPTPSWLALGIVFDSLLIWQGNKGSYYILMSSPWLFEYLSICLLPSFTCFCKLPIYVLGVAGK